jgi:hypothetical protein
VNTAGREPSNLATYTVKWLGDAQFTLLLKQVLKTLDAAGGSINKVAFENGLLKWLVRQVAATLNGHTPVTGAQLKLALAGNADGVYEPWRPALMNALRIMEDADVLYVSADGTQYVRCLEPSKVPVTSMARRRARRVHATG